MKNSSEKTIVENFLSLGADKSIDINGLRVNNQNYQTAEIFRQSLFKVCATALEHLSHINDDKRKEATVLEIADLLKFAGNIDLQNEMEILDDLKDFEAKKKAVILNSMTFESMMNKKPAPHEFTLTKEEINKNELQTK